MALSDIRRELYKWRSLVWGILDPELAANGEVLTADGSGSASYQPAGGGGSAELPLNYLAGLDTRLAADADHDVTIAVGECRDDDDSDDIVLSSEITKRIDADWAAGDTNGGLATGARSVANTPDANTWYHYFLIFNGTLVDAGWDTSLSATNLLADATGYTHYRRIASHLSNGSNNLTAYFQDGIRFWFEDDVSDFDAAPATVQTNVALTTPEGVQVWADLICSFANATSATSVNIGPTDEVMGVPSATNGRVLFSSPSADATVSRFFERTNTSREISYRASGVNSSDLRINTKGWLDFRGIHSSGGGGGGTVPGGVDTQVQYNDSGAFGGSPGLTFDDFGHRLVIGDATTVPDLVLNAPAGNVANIVFQESGVNRAFIIWSDFTDDLEIRSPEELFFSAASGDVLRFATNGQGTFEEKVILNLGQTAQASITLPHGVAPTSPVNGDMWTTTGGLFVEVNGTTVGPLIDASSAGGVWVEIEQRNITAVANEDFTWDETAYVEIKMVIEDIIPATDGASMEIQLGSANGATIYTGASDYVGVLSNLTAVAWQTMSPTDAIQLGNAVGSNAGESMDATIHLKNYRSANTGANVTVESTFVNSSGDEQFRVVHAGLDGINVAVDTIRVQAAAGNLEANGTIRLYGLSE